jgi:hypothetical protein
MPHPVAALLLVLALPLVQACTGDDGDEEETNTDTNEARVTHFEDSVLGIVVDGLDMDSRLDLDDDEEWYAEAKVTIRNGGTHDILVEEDNNPVMSDDNDSDRVTDQTTGNVRIFESDQEFENFVVRDESNNSITVGLNPDDTWVVGGQTAQDVDEAAALLVQSPVIRDASLHGLAFIEVMMRYRADEVSSRAMCGCGGNGTGCYGGGGTGNQNKPIMQPLVPSDEWEEWEEEEDDVVSLLAAVIVLRMAP